MKKLMIAAAFAVAALSGAQVQAATYIRLPNGTVMPKHECSTSPCVDCTFLDYKTCYEQADKLGLIDKNVGLGPGQRPPLYLGRREEPLEREVQGILVKHHDEPLSGIRQGSDRLPGSGRSSSRRTAAAEARCRGLAPRRLSRRRRGGRDILRAKVSGLPDSSCEAAHSHGLSVPRARGVGAVQRNSGQHRKGRQSETDQRGEGAVRVVHIGRAANNRHPR
jgi:hypothetical protein